MLYPIAIEKGSDTEAFGVVFPDVEGCFSAGDSFEEALINAKEALTMHLELLAEQGELPPLATSVDQHIDNLDYQGWVWALVDIDVEPYMGKANKVNVTLPNLLIKKIDDAVEGASQYKNRSHFLQVAAAHELSANI
ncbi:type II toxin-antitoxin system HicB family antitoxin [uncultured Shewanella sp.]|uniref:type II toxin-antitoxin system HicB family antitoxin n=1 Tax=uncultured Shewanella sp. TaxID=173975 RepID=UPI0026028D4B|nr:type II toxin-antitoxin system HicB family antitoxin [uncultured Shewanella sp.]